MLLKMIRICLDIKSKFNNIVSEYDLTFSQWQVLKVINSSKKRQLTINEIIFSLNSDKATISQIIKNLEKKEMIVISKDYIDKRKKNISLSDKMKKKCFKLKEIEEEFLSDVFKELNKNEIKELNLILNKIDGSFNES